MVDADAEQAQRVNPTWVDSAQPEHPAGQCHTNIARVEVVPHRMDEEDEIGEVSGMVDVGGVLEGDRDCERVGEHAYPGGERHQELEGPEDACRHEEPAENGEDERGGEDLLGEKREDRRQMVSRSFRSGHPVPHEDDRMQEQPPDDELPDVWLVGRSYLAAEFTFHRDAPESVPHG